MRCNVHHLRELTFLEEEYQQARAGELKDVLRAMRRAAADARAQGRQRVPSEQRDLLFARYRALLAAGLAANPPPKRQREPSLSQLRLTCYVRCLSHYSGNRCLLGMLPLLAQYMIEPV